MCTGSSAAVRVGHRGGHRVGGMQHVSGSTSTNTGFARS
jgi:hypothetical protein